MCYIECVCTTVPEACAAVMGEVGSCCRELVEMCWLRKVVPETLDTRKRMERLLQVFTRLDENGKRCVGGCGWVWVFTGSPFLWQLQVTVKTYVHIALYQVPIAIPIFVQGE